MCYQAMYVITDIALVTDGDKTSLWCDYRDLMGEKWVINTIPHPIAQIVDTISAGDVFNADFRAAVIHEKDIETVACMGHQLASIVIQHKGAIIPKEATDVMTNAFFTSHSLTGRGENNV